MADTLITNVNVVLDNGGSNQLTVHTLSIEETWSKEVKLIKRPSTGSLKTTKILDLLRMEQRFELRGYIDSVDKTKFRNIIKTRGIIAILNYDSEAFNVVFEKINIGKSTTEVKDVIITGTDRAETEYLDVAMTYFVGEDL